MENSSRTARVLAVVGADGAGKTTLVESLRGPGDALDADPEEHRHGFTLVMRAVALTDWSDGALHLLDTPGAPGFPHEVARAIHVADATLLLVPAVSSLRHNADRLVDLVADSGKPFLCVITRIDDEDADVDEAIAAAKERWKLPLLRLAHVPDPPMVEAAAEADDELLDAWMKDGTLGDEQVIRGLALAFRRGAVVPALAVSARTGAGIDDLVTWIERLVPAPDERRREDPVALQVFRTAADPYAGRLSFARVIQGTLTRDAVLVDGRSHREERIARILRTDGTSLREVARATAGEIVVLPKLKEVRTGDTLTDRAHPVELPPLPEPERPVIAAIRSESPEEKIALALHRAVEEDPALAFVHAPAGERAEMLLHGVSEAHLAVTVERVSRKHHVDLELGVPQPAYRETIRVTAEGHGRYKRQTGGHGQFGDCRITLRPLPRGSGLAFEDAIFGGAIPRPFIPSVEKGVRGALQSGPLGGFPLVDLQVTLDDGQYHDVDSSDMAFQIAGSMAVKDALPRAGAVLLEPIMRVEAIVPDEMLGTVVTDLNGRRGRVQGMDPLARGTKITAYCPHAELLHYDRELRAITQGAGVFRMAHSHWEVAPPIVAQRVIAAHPRPARPDAHP